MARPSIDFRAYGVLVVVMALWAGNSIVGRAVHDQVPPFTLAFVRWAGALVILTPIAGPAAWRERAAIARAWKPILLLGFVGVACFNAFLYLGLRYTTATNGLLLQALIPALVLAISFAVFRERASRLQVAGVAISTLGVAVIVFRADPAAILQLRFGFGDGIVLCGCLAWALYTALLRLRPQISPASFLYATFALGALCMAPLAASEAPEIARIRWTPTVLGAFAYVAVLPSVGAYYLYNWAVDRLGAGSAGQAISLMPLMGAVMAALLLHEPLRSYHLAGMALILGGITLGGLGGRSIRGSPPPPLGLRRDSLR